MEKLLVFLCMLHVCYGVIYKLNESEYARMPPIYEGESFEKCHWDPDAVYCFGEFELFSDTPSPLLHMIQEFSAHNTTHFNHTKIRRGVCVTETCTKFNVTGLDSGKILEACVNESTFNKYQLQTKLTKRYFCNQPPKDMKIDTSDIVVGVICALILLVNLIGSLYEIYCGDRKNGVSRFLLCFSIRNNWRKLTAPIAEGHDPRLRRLKSIHGIRTMSIILVIMAHSILACVVYIDNPEYLEEMYNFEPLKIVFSGMIIMQTFLMMSGFLLVYNLLLTAEKHKITWAMLPKFIVLRWLRLTPPYAVVFALTITWLRYLTAGPLWQELIANEVTDCKHYWWMNILYINNYNDNSQCMLHTWYIAADTQLYIFGVIVYLALSTPRSRKIVLPILLVAGCIIPGIHTYFQNLDGSLISSPEAIHSIFIHEPTFNNTYRRGHTNLAGCVIGLSLGYLVYHWQKTGIDIIRLRKYRVCVPLLVPPALGVIYICSLFFADAPRPPLYVRVISACLIKPLFGFIIALGLTSFIFKIDDLCRYTVEWRGWTVPSRLSYSAYLIHNIFIRQYVAMQTTITHTSFLFMCQVFISFVLASFITAVPLSLIVEAPVGNLIKEYIMKQKKSGDKVDEVKQNGIKQDNVTTISDAEIMAIEKIISLKNLREILSDGQYGNTHI